MPDTAGFVVNRLLFPYLFEAVRLMERTGLEPEAIDTCMQLGAGHPLGPLALLDLVGLDVSAAIGRTIGADVPERIERMIGEGALGRKAGRGFYTYDELKRRSTLPAGVRGSRSTKLDLVQALVGRDALGHPGHQRVAVHLLARDHEGHRDLAAALVRAPDDGALGHRGMAAPAPPRARPAPPGAR